MRPGRGGALQDASQCGEGKAWYTELDGFGMGCCKQTGVVPSAQAASVPCVPGSEGLISSDQEALDVVAKIGLPVMIKATAGAWELVRLRACRDGELLQIIHSAC